MKLQPKQNIGVFVGDSQHSHVTLYVNMARLEQELKFGLIPSSDLNNLLKIVKKNVHSHSTDMV